MKLLQPEEIKTAKERELSRDILRTQTVKDALDSAKRELNETNAKFERVLAEQRVTWLKEEESATLKLESLKKEIAELEKARDAALIPIDAQRKKAQDLMKSGEQIIELVLKRKAEVEAREAKVEETTEQLENKLDGLSEREQSLDEREQKLLVREQANTEERENIKRLSQELLNKLNTL